MLEEAEARAKENQREESESDNKEADSIGYQSALVSAEGN